MLWLTWLSTKEINCGRGTVTLRGITGSTEMLVEFLSVEKVQAQRKLQSNIERLFDI